VPALGFLWVAGKAIKAIYTAHHGKVAVTAAVATATAITIEIKQLGDAAVDNFNQGEQNLEKYSGDLVSLVKA
jgi:hypothetical protein